MAEAAAPDVNASPVALRSGSADLNAAGPEGEVRQWWLGATDAGRRGLTIAAVAVPLLKGEWRNAGSSALALAVAHQLCTLAKHTISEVRPDGSDDQSFASSHSLEAFSAATSLMISAGPPVGLPAYAAATLVGYGRLRAQRHHRIDVIMGAAAGALASFLIDKATETVATRYRG